MTDPTPQPGADPARPDPHPARPKFPYGYTPETAALLLCDLIRAIDLVNDGQLPGNTGINPLVYAAESLAAALAAALEGVTLPAEVRT